ncbi:MAG: polysaccharide deacetylase family protein [Turicibacter sp.]
MNKKNKIVTLACLVVIVLAQSMTIQAKEVVELQVLNEITPIALKLDKRKVPEKWNGKQRKIVYLTFDDGPSKNTQSILNILEQYNIEATFFVIGSNVMKRPEDVKRVSDKNHFIGLHTMTHDRKIIYNLDTPYALVNELNQLQEILEPIIGKKPQLLRPPYGSHPGIKPPIADSLVENDYKVWDWTVDTLDWKYKSTEDIMNYVKQQTDSPTEVVLMHEKDISVAVLPQVIEYYLNLGYEFRPYNPENHLMINLIHDDRL